jgi:sugar phosphate isomerase/epimerase
VVQKTEDFMALKVGIQIYSVRKNMANDPVETIRKVAEIGYKYLETANLFNPNDYGTGFGGSAREIRKILDGFGSKIFSAHVFPLDLTNIDKVLDYYNELGAEYLHSKPLYGTVDDVKRQAELFSRLGEKCREKGIRHGIHNGFTPYCEDGSYSLDRMAEFTSPEDLLFEIDTYWAMRAGKDPVELIKKYKERIHIIHQKDCPKDFHGVMNMNSVIPMGSQSSHEVISKVLKEDEFCEIGTGTMELQKIIDITIAATKASFIVLEQDFTTLDEFDSIKLSMNNFKKCYGLVFD